MQVRVIVSGKEPVGQVDALTHELFNKNVEELD
jgi:hypothetical protein